MVMSFFIAYLYGTNCNVKIFIGSDDEQTRREFSELCGQKKIKNFSVNTNAENPASSNTGATNQPLITIGMLERLNGDEKGDAIVSVRGYEPIWTKFTPSYKLKDLYFGGGKADLSHKEATVFNKADYLFDISPSAISREDLVIGAIEKAEAQTLNNEEIKAAKLQELDKQWLAVKKEVDGQIEKISQFLTGVDCARFKQAKLENKALLLCELMQNYSQSKAMRMQRVADNLTVNLLPQLKKLQNEAIKIKGGYFENN